MGQSEAGAEQRLQAWRHFKQVFTKIAPIFALEALRGAEIKFPSIMWLQSLCYWNPSKGQVLCAQNRSLLSAFSASQIQMSLSEVCNIGMVEIYKLFSIHSPPSDILGYLKVTLLDSHVEPILSFKTEVSFCRNPQM